MKAEELLGRCEKEIDNPWFNWKFFWYSFKGEFKEFRNIVTSENIKDKDEVETFIGICDNRIDRAKAFLSDIVTVLSLLIALLAVIASILVGSGIIKKAEKQNPLISIWLDTGWTFQILTILLILIALLLFLLLCHYRAQIHAWYAVKEGILLMKKKKNEIRD